jgi:hypothetical protein
MRALIAGCAILIGACSTNLTPVEGVPRCTGADAGNPVGVPTVVLGPGAATILDGGTSRVPLEVRTAIPCLRGFVHASVETSAGGFEADGSVVTTTTIVLAFRQVDAAVAAGNVALDLDAGDTAFVIAQVGEQVGTACIVAPDDGGVAVPCPTDQPGGTAR